MTIEHALDAAKLLRFSQFPDETLVAWLAQLDGQIDQEMIRTHEGAPEAAFVPYTDTTDRGTTLLAPAPYDKLYVDFLVSAVDFGNADYGRYNNTGRRFEAAYQDFSDWYNRTHRPLQGSTLQTGGTREASSLPPELEA